MSKIITSSMLIEHLIPSETNLITETIKSETGRHLWLNGVFMQSSVQNRNGRVYPLHEIQSAVDNANARIKESNGIFGELDHPQSLNINLDRISHVITEMKMVGNDAHGKAKLLDTPMGRIGTTLIESKVRIGVSSRGAGQVNESVVSDFAFVTVDLVAQPSAPGALPDNIYESLCADKNGREVLSLAQQLREDVAAQKFFITEISKFLNNSNWSKLK